jgi:hypothetical protein
MAGHRRAYRLAHRRAEAAMQPQTNKVQLITQKELRNETHHNFSNASFSEIPDSVSMVENLFGTETPNVVE